MNGDVSMDGLKASLHLDWILFTSNIIHSFIHSCMCLFFFRITLGHFNGPTFSLLEIAMFRLERGAPFASPNLRRGRTNCGQFWAALKGRVGLS
jgi:hypothetical protein